ncbi:MAG: GAF domain-containing sensor histidine kinase [Chloroflexi bacterium]|nr:GAF domain-containing sensor histidine kinase [Chloroflexota bacterium]
MRQIDSPFLVDWIAVSVRWLALLGLALSLAAERPLDPSLIIILLSAAVWNMLLTLLALLNRRLPLQRPLSLAGDVLVAALLFYFSMGGVAWAGLLPLIPAALFYGMRGALIAAPVLLAGQSAIAWLYNDLTVALVYLVSLLPVYFLFGAGLAFLGQRMNRAISQAQRSKAASRLESERAERERSQALYKLISTMNASLNYQRVLENALDMSYSTLAAFDDSGNRMVSCVLLFAGQAGGEGELRIEASRRLTPADMRITLPGKGGLVGQTIDHGAARLDKGIAQDVELNRFVALRACQAAYCIPLSTGLETYGALLFAHPDQNYFTQERREILDVVGSQAVVAMQNARLYRDLEQEKERMAEIQEEARKKLARDLHDGPTQSVAALAMRVNFARRLMERDPKAAADELFKVEDLARKTTKEIRHMLFTLRPLVLESQGLVAALESMAEKMRETYSQNVVIEADPAIISELEMGKQGVVFYIVEEAVNNARKHARAVSIGVRLKPAGDDLAVLEVEDSGVGFDVGKVDASYENRGSLGLVNMRERAELINGLLQIESTPGKGTRIRLVIPLNESASDRIRRGI